MDDISGMTLLRSLWVGVIVSAPVACGPGDGESNTDDSTSATETATSVTETSPTTTTAASDSTDSTGPGSDCAPAPEPTAGEPQDYNAMLTALCAARDEANCNGVIEPKGSDLCQWVTTKSYSPDASTCEEAKSGGACIALRYYGDGCLVSTICGDGTEGDVFYRTDSGCQTEVFAASFCGYSVLGWSRCIWDMPASESSPQPLPTSGPRLCNCEC